MEPCGEERADKEDILVRVPTVSRSVERPLRRMKVVGVSEAGE
jgi:hypothetical protein